MNLHEYQSKALLKAEGVNVPLEFMVENAKDAVEYAKIIHKKTERNAWA